MKDLKSHFHYRSRFYFLVAVSTLMLGLLTAKLIWVQLLHQADYERLAMNQYRTELKVPAPRGEIRDCRGVVLATNEPGQHILSCRTRYLKGADREKAIDYLSGRLRIEKPRLRTRLDTSRVDVYISRGIGLQLKQELETWFHDSLKSTLSGTFGFIPYMKRVYPGGNIACQVIGRMNPEGVGILGVEQEMEDLLKGRDGILRYGHDRSHSAFYWDELDHTPTVPGASIELTLDSRVQAIIQEEMEQTCQEFNAAYATSIVMNPRTGEIIAMGSWPDYDLNRGVVSTRQLSAQRNRAVADLYEPGSTFKTHTFALLLENHELDLEDSVFCYNGRYRIGRWLIRDSHEHGFGWIPGWKVFSESSNIGTAVLSDTLTAEDMYRWLHHFGFGSYTFIDLPAEERGVMQPLQRWGDVVRANISFGQGISVTPLQMLVSYIPYFNQGQLLKPWIVRRIIQPDGTVIERNPEVRRDLRERNILSDSTLATLHDLLTRVVEEGTGQAAAIPGLRVMGKTGTAQKPVAAGGYSSEDYVASFIGYVEITDQPFLALMLVDCPRKKIWGGEVAGSLFRHVFERVQHLRWTPESGTPLQKDRQELYQLPDFTGLSGRALERALKRADISHHEMIGSGQVVSQSPAAGSYFAAPALTLYLQDDSALSMPDLRGMDAAEALHQVSVLGLNISIQGHGVVTDQSLSPGTEIQTAEQLLLTCALEEQP